VTEVPGIERQDRLQPQEHIAEQSAGDAEQQQRERVGRPRHVLVLAHAEDPVEQPLDRAQWGRQPRALAGEDTGHVGAHGLRQDQDQAEE